jgi:hypothetical protein
MQEHTKPAKSKTTSVSSASKNQGEGDKQSARGLARTKGDDPAVTRKK